MADLCVRTTPPLVSIHQDGDIRDIGLRPLYRRSSRASLLNEKVDARPILPLPKVSDASNKAKPYDSTVQVPSIGVTPRAAESTSQDGDTGDPLNSFKPAIVMPLPAVSDAAVNPCQRYVKDPTGQLPPPGMKPRVTAILWEDEGSLCFQVEARGFCVARREDNHMINGTKLLNVAGMTRGRRDGILKSEKVRHVVKIGPMHLKGVWIPYERALEVANKEHITELLYPLFVHNIGALLYHPTNQNRTSQVMSAAERRKAEQDQLRTPPAGLPSIQHQTHSMFLPGPQPSQYSATKGRPSLDRRHIFPTPPTSASSVMASTVNSDSPQWQGQSMLTEKDPEAAHPLAIDTGLSNARPVSSTPVSTPPVGPPEYTPDGCNPIATRTVGSALGAHDPHPHHSSSINRSIPGGTHGKQAARLRKDVGDLQMYTDNDKRKPNPGADDDLPSQKRRALDPDNTTLLRQSGKDPVAATQNRSADNINYNSESDLDSPSNASTSTFTTSTTSDTSGQPLLTASERKRTLLDRLMAHFYALIFSSCQSPTLSVRTCGGGAGSTRSGTTSSLEQGSSGGSRQDASPSANSTSNKNKSRKRAGEDNEDDDQGSSRKRTQMEDNHEQPTQKLACPFFKKNPRAYTGWRSCPGPGWTDMHRLKEHVYRNHTLPITCPRCQEVFDNESLRNEHLKLDTQCPLLPSKELEGIDSTQKELLRSRKKRYKGITEFERWHDMYLIIFPDTDPLSVPTPFYDYVIGTNDSSGESSGDELTRYEQFLRRELPNRVRQELEVRINERLNPVEESLRTELVEIARDMQLRLFEIYKSSRRDASSSAAPAVDADNSSERFEASSSGQAAQLPSWEEELQPYWQPMYTDDSLGGFNGEFWNFSGVQAGSQAADSGYDSLLLVMDESYQKAEGLN